MENPIGQFLTSRMPYDGRQPSDEVVSALAFKHGAQPV
jgi:hypothetical protein